MTQEKKGPSFFAWNRSLQSSTNVFSVITAMLILALILDNMINYVADFLVPQITSSFGISLFIIIGIIFAVGQFLVLEFVKQKSKEIRSKDIRFNIIQIVTTSVQYTILIVLALLILQILVGSYYNLVLLPLVYAISHVLAIALSILAGIWLLKLYVLDRGNISVLLYGLFFVVYAIPTSAVTIEHLIVLSDKDPIVTAKSEVIFPSFEPGTLLDNISTLYSYLDILSFVLIWIATVTLLHHYSKKIGQTRFWVLISLPLLYFLSTVIDQLGIYSPQGEQQEFYYYLYVSLNSTAGGILFALVFRLVANSLRQESSVRDYMLISALGFILVFISNQANLMPAPYPPYGFATVSMSGLASYLVLVGLYSSAVSVSQDAKLRRSIKKMASNNSNLLSSIGTAHMEQEIQRTVNSMKEVVQEQEKELEEQTGIEANLEEDEMKNYLEEVMQEVGKSKKPSI